jgi:hypothetical protein
MLLVLAQIMVRIRSNETSEVVSDIRVTNPLEHLHAIHNRPNALVIPSTSPVNTGRR